MPKRLSPSTCRQQGQPFGEECCEDEVAVFKDQYSDYYFQNTPFNERAVAEENYLFIGRRGSGKSSLAHYFTFQDILPKARCVDVDEPKLYELVLSKMAEHAATRPELALPRIVDVWQFLIWSLIFDELSSEDLVIDSARFLTSQGGSASALIRDILKRLLTMFLHDESSQVSDELEEFLISGPFNSAKNRSLEILGKRPLIVAIDSLEKYSVDNEPMMLATAALVECASKINRECAGQGLHLKVFLSAEIFPQLEESEIANPSKYVRNPVYLHWRPRDLIRLVSWRLNEYFRRVPELRSSWRRDVDWDNSIDVISKVWNPQFGELVLNGQRRSEPTFPYVLRHTQLRPRQFIILCNHIARIADDIGAFPLAMNQILARAIKDKEKALASEVLNSYSKVYPNVANIVRAIERFPMVFSGKDLDRAAPSTASQWSSGGYSPFAFRRILAELGIVGRVRKWQKTQGKEVIEADFEYALEDRLTLPSKEKCVIHPMFFEKLGIRRSHEVIIYPFPDHPDFKFSDDQDSRAS